MKSENDKAFPEVGFPPEHLSKDKKLDVREILNGLEHYRPRKHPWHWREGRGEERKVGDFVYRETSESLTNSVPLPGSRGFGYIDPQPDCVITTEIASGRFEDDIRRMRMAAWNGADHIMVIRTAGQSHIDSLILPKIGRASCRERV